MAQRTVNPLVQAFRELMRAKNFHKYRSWYYQEHDGILLCLYLQRSIFDTSYYLNVGLTDTLLLTENQLPADLSEWHAASRADRVIPDIDGEKHRVGAYPDSTSKEVLSRDIDIVMEYLGSAAQAIVEGNPELFPSEVLWVQNVTKKDLFRRRE